MDIMTFFSEYSRIKDKVLKAAFNFINPFYNYEVYYKNTLYSDLRVKGIPLEVRKIVLDSLENVDIMRAYDLKTQSFVESASFICDCSLPIDVMALLRLGHDGILQVYDNTLVQGYLLMLTSFWKSIEEIIKANGVESIITLSEAGVKFGDLPIDQISTIVKSLGIDSIKPLVDVGVKVPFIIDIYSSQGIDSIKMLTGLGVKLDDLQLIDVVDIISTLGLESIIALSDASTKLENLDLDSIIYLVEALGIDSIKPLSEAGVKFKCMNFYMAEELVYYVGTNAIEPLSKAGVNFDRSIEIQQEELGVSIPDGYCNGFV